MPHRRPLPWLLSLLCAPAAFAQPYDFAEADALLTGELPNLDGHVAVLVRQGGVELYRFQAGDIGFDTKTRLASFTKTVSAGVVLSLLDDGVLAPDERLGDAFALFEKNGLGDPTVLDCWAMRHGIETPLPYHRDPRYTLVQSVALIGSTGTVAFPHGTQLGYDGLGMQTVGLMAVQRERLEWEAIARARIFDRCGMPEADYRQFDPNPAVAGGLRSSANETMSYAQMIIDRGWYDGARVLSDASITMLFTNLTRGLPVHASPWPPTHPLYPYGTDPDYGFGDWVFAEHPATQHVEEIVGAGAWGSFIWIDRRRGLTAVLITDITPGTQSSMDAALGLFDIARRVVESAQVTDLSATPEEAAVRLSWHPVADAIASRVYGAPTPIRDVFDLADAPFLVETSGSTTLVPPFTSYAVTAVLPELENTAIVPDGNAIVLAPCPADLDGNRVVDLADLLAILSAWGPCSDCPEDLDDNGTVDLSDLLLVLSSWGVCP